MLLPDCRVRGKIQHLRYCGCKLKCGSAFVHRTRLNRNSVAGLEKLRRSSKCRVASHADVNEDGIRIWLSDLPAVLSGSCAASERFRPCSRSFSASPGNTAQEKGQINLPALSEVQGPPRIPRRTRWHQVAQLPAQRFGCPSTEPWGASLKSPSTSEHQASSGSSMPSCKEKRHCPATSSSDSRGFKRNPQRSTPNPSSAGIQNLGDTEVSESSSHRRAGTSTAASPLATSFEDLPAILPQLYLKQVCRIVSGVTGSWDDARNLYLRLALVSSRSLGKGITSLPSHSRQHNKCTRKAKRGAVNQVPVARLPSGIPGTRRVRMPMVQNLRVVMSGDIEGCFATC